MKLRLAVPLLIALISTSAQAGVNRWTPSLPDIVAYEVAIDPLDSAVAYAATETGIFKTTNRGEDWLLVEAFPRTISVAIDPHNAATVIAGTWDDWTWKAHLRISDDAGATWRESRPFAIENGVGALRFDRREPGVVYAALYNNGVGRSTDAGKTWTTSDWRNGLKCCLIDFFTTWEVAVGGVEGTTVYAASSYLQSSRDATASWQPVDMPRGPGGEVLEPWSITIDPTDRARLYVTGVFQPHGGGAAFTSSDGGETWHRLGNHWVGKITVDPLVPTTLYITQPIGYGGPTGIFRSTNRGDNWTAFNTGLTNLDASSVTLDATGTFLYAVTPSGIFVQELRVPARRRGAGK